MQWKNGIGLAGYYEKSFIMGGDFECAILYNRGVNGAECRVKVANGFVGELYNVDLDFCKLLYWNINGDFEYFDIPFESDGKVLFFDLEAYLRGKGVDTALIDEVDTLIQFYEVDEWIFYVGEHEYVETMAELPAGEERLCITHYVNHPEKGWTLEYQEMSEEEFAEFQKNLEL